MSRNALAQVTTPPIGLPARMSFRMETVALLARPPSKSSYTVVARRERRRGRGRCEVGLVDTRLELFRWEL